MIEFRIEWEDAPGVAIPIFARTWARLEFRLGSQPLTRFLSEKSGSVRDGVYVSVFPLAQWLVSNWWTILNEGLRSPAAIDAGGRRRDRIHAHWLRRHNLLSCRQGMAYPDLTLFREDDQLSAIWVADPGRVTTDGRFLDSGSVRIPMRQAEASLRRFVCSVVERVEDLADEDVVNLIETWRAIDQADADERILCGRMALIGLDPYSADLSDALERRLSELELPSAIARDLLAVTNAAEFESDFAATTELLKGLPRTSASSRPILAPQLPTLASPPYSAGYARASALRKAIGLADDQPIGDLSELCQRVLSGLELQWTAPDSSLVEAALQLNGTAAISAGRRHATAQRFLLARALHHWVYVMSSGGDQQRLLTKGGDWQQAASRAFAAELLAPARALEARLAGGTGWEREAELAQEFAVSSMVIAHQVENHGLG